VQFPSTAALSVYVGHDGLMDFAIESRFQGERQSQRETIVLACASKLFFFANGLKSTEGAATFVDNRIDGTRGVHAEGGGGWLAYRGICGAESATRSGSICEIPKV
jgi:hypothetical protein